MELKQALDRWTDKILPSREDFERALEKNKLTIYHGVDPTGPDLHLGHSTNYLLMHALQDSGHKIILLMGTFTALIGDASDKTETRKRPTKEEIEKNLRTYKAQAGKILRFEGENPVEIKFNANWLSKLTFEDVIELSAEFTVQQMIERDMFQKRLSENKPLYLHELLYPLAQGYDSVAMDVDVEIGGTEQTFNMLVGRTLVKSHLNKEKFVISTPLLINPKTGVKMMSKTLGNYISLQDEPNNMFGKIMALPDETIIPCLSMCTTIQTEEIENLEEELKTDPMKIKKILGLEIVKMYHNEKESQEAQKEWELTFQKGEMPEDIQLYTLNGEQQLIDVLVDSGMSTSRSEARRLIEQGGVEINGEKTTSWDKIIDSKSVLKIGKHRFLKVEK